MDDRAAATGIGEVMRVLLHGQLVTQALLAAHVASVPLTFEQAEEVAKAAATEYLSNDVSMFTMGEMIRRVSELAGEAT
jgi:hypothetical protein